MKSELVNCVAHGYVLAVRYIEDGQVFETWTFQIFSDSPLSSEHLFFLKEGNRDEALLNLIHELVELSEVDPQFD